MDQTIKTLLCDEITRNMNDCIVIIPTYNEIENIESIIRSVLSQHKPFLIVDDNSPDRTADRSDCFKRNLVVVYFGNREKKRD
jgi:dolichol-phosphate mannosyltransferase